MKLDDIPGGTLCVIDTNVLLYAEQGASLQAQRLLRRIERGDLLGTLPQPVWQELTHKLMLAEAHTLGLVSGGNPARQLASKPDAVKHLSGYREKIKALSTLGLGFEPCTKSDMVEVGLELQARYGLLTNDSVILAIAMRLEADALISADARFQACKEIKVYAPSDIALR
ncbi:MAG TPA: type II toxin-antitoxin system VapC family toxin [Terriglobales bacterium]|jgi:predicted nucleic acid-binding protein|nr:type II toxin-antitoxin system VapC family toxin [Terriglobales bacterium]